jgi:hypothetical protein
MKDLLTGTAFLLMILSPCVVAMFTGVHVGSDLGRRDPAATDDGDSSEGYIPE